MIYPRPHPAEFAIDAPDSEIKPFEAWSRGLGIAFDETNGLPEMEGLNGLFQAITKYIKYLEQNGFAEWIADLEYPVGAGVRLGTAWYRAKTQNTGKNPINNQSDWELFLNASALGGGDAIYIENNTVKIRDASTTQKGAVRFANASEVASRSNSNVVVNPANVAQMFSRTQNQITLPDGTIMKWGNTPHGDVSNVTNFNIAFPSPFPNACLNVTANESGTQSCIVNTTSLTRSGFIARVWESNSNVSSGSISWFAVGY